MDRRHFFEQLAAVMAVPAGATPSLEAPRTPSPVDFPPWLAAWRSLPQRPVWSCEDPQVLQLIAAAKTQRSLLVRYQRGSTPGTQRRFTPALVFQTGDHPGAPLYVNGWCHVRQQHRTLRLEHLVVLSLPT